MEDEEEGGEDVKTESAKKRKRSEIQRDAKNAIPYILECPTDGEAFQELIDQYAKVSE